MDIRSNVLGSLKKEVEEEETAGFVSYLAYVAHR